MFAYLRTRAHSPTHGQASRLACFRSAHRRKVYALRLFVNAETRSLLCGKRHVSAHFYSYIHTLFRTLHRRIGSAGRRNSVVRGARAYSPALAAMLLRYSIFSYYDPDGHPTDSGWGPMDGV